MPVTQATLSRDLEELGAVRLRAADGSLVYALPEEPGGPGSRPGGGLAAGSAVGGGQDLAGEPGQPRPAARLARVASELLISAEASANMVVLRTPAGAAQFLASVHRPRGLAVHPRHRGRRRHGAGHRARPGRRRRPRGATARAGRAPALSAAADRCGADPVGLPSRSLTRGQAMRTKSVEQRRQSQERARRPGCGAAGSSRARPRRWPGCRSASSSTGGWPRTTCSPPGRTPGCCTGPGC